MLFVPFTRGTYEGLDRHPGEDGCVSGKPRVTLLAYSQITHRPRLLRSGREHQREYKLAVSRFERRELCEILIASDNGAASPNKDFIIIRRFLKLLNKNISNFDDILLFYFLLSRDLVTLFDVTLIKKITKLYFVGNKLYYLA